MSQHDKLFGKVFTYNQRLRIALFLLFTCCLLAVSLFFFILSIGKPFMGITLSLNTQGWVVEKVDPNGVTKQAGITKGDVPIEINGQPADSFLGKYRESGQVFGGLLKELTVVDSSGRLKAAVLEGGDLSWQGTFEQSARFFVSLVFWVVGFFVFFKRPGKAPSLLLCLIGLLIGLMLSSNMAVARGIPTAGYFDAFATNIGPWLLLHFFLILPEERAWLNHKPFVYAIYLPAAVNLVLFPLIGYPNGQPVIWFQNVRYFEAGIGLLATTGIAIFNYFRAASFRTRQQMKIILVTCLAAFIPFSVLNLFPVAIWRQSILPPEFSILLVGFIPIGMGYAVIAQKLWDIDVIIRRGVIYGFITLVMATIVSTSIFLAGASKQSLGIPQQIFIALVLGGVATALFGPVRTGIEIVIDKFFYKDRHDYRKTIQTLATSLNTFHDVNGMSRLTVSTSFHTLNLAGCCLFIKAQSGSLIVSAAQGSFTDVGKQGQFLALIAQRHPMLEFSNPASTTCRDLAFLIPLSVGEKGIGFLCVSQKVSRQDFSPNDIYLLQGIASTASISLHNAMLTRDVNIRDTFVSVASHELRTPLTSIVGYADLLLHRDPPDETRKRWLKHIFDGSQRVSTMVDDLLNISRIQSGKTNMKLEEVNITGILEDILSMIRESTKKHEFIVKMDTDLPTVLVDREKFGQVVGNLLSNAVKYSPNGGLITLSAHNVPAEHRILVSVADEGIGISQEDRTLLFTTFHRIQRPETKGIRGSGLGLYIAKEWTEAMGGKIWLESELDKGSTFFIAVPVHASGEGGTR